jgi:PEP-CTERM motif
LQAEDREREKSNKDNVACSSPSFPFFPQFLITESELPLSNSCSWCLTFTVTPTDVSGPAGTTVGWGFSISNTSTTDYLDISGIDSDLFAAADGTPDASIFLFPNLAPGQTATQAYDPVAGLGLFQFTWNPGVATGTMESGQFRLMGAFCDPSVDQFCAEDVSVASVVLATGAYTATVSPGSTTAVPEPSSFLLLLSGLCGIGLWTSSRRRHEYSGVVRDRFVKTVSDPQEWQIETM